MTRALTCRRCGEMWTGSQPCLACRVEIEALRRGALRWAAVAAAVLIAVVAAIRLA